MKRSSTQFSILASVVLLSTALATGCGSSSSQTDSTNVAPTQEDHPAGTMMPGGGQGGSMKAADTSSIQKKYLDLAYASNSNSQKLDIYLPNEGKGPFPVIIAIHGGGFMLGDKADGQLSPMLQALDRGYAVVSVNYRLSQESQFPAQIYDIKAAIRYVKANAAKYNLNPDKVATWGGSAGGNLSALAGTTGGVKELEDLSMGNANVSSNVEAVVDWFGPIDFSKMDEQFKASGVGQANHNEANSPESKLIGKPIQEALDLVKKANPTTYISEDDPAFFIQHGTQDGNVPIQQSENFAAALTQVLGSDKVTFEKIEGAQHGGSQFETKDNVQKVLNFLDKTLK